MSEYMFGTGNKKLSGREIKRRDRICKEEGGFGFTCVNLPGKGWTSWFSGPNYGSPFDQNLCNRVLDKVNSDF